jgi:flagellar basal-body rod modification protein FlgD
MFGTKGADFNMFLKLLTTQMQNQDPLSPMDTAQYTQQLVQYSQVEQSITQTGVLRDILGRLSTQDLSQASNLIGRQVEVSSEFAGLGNEPAQWTYELPAGAKSATATIKDASGRIVSTRALDVSSQRGSVAWDGTLSNGGKALDGVYSLIIQTTDGTSESSAEVHTIGMVRDVSSAGGSLSVGINGAQHDASKILRVTA